MPHEFDSLTPATAALPRLAGDGPRMTDDEARAVIDLWQSEQMGSPEHDRPTPADVAEGLGINTEDAARLLSQVRQQRETARQSALALQNEELAHAERAAHLAELRARQAEAEARAAEAEAREQRADADAHRARYDRLREPRLSKYAYEPRISPPTPEQVKAATEHEQKVREWGQRWARFAWLVFILALAASVVLHH